MRTSSSRLSVAPFLLSVMILLKATSSFVTMTAAPRAGLSMLRPLASPSLLTSRSYSRSTALSAKLKTAIVGLPNVGKSTLFNALTETQGAEAANYPFCTIEPNVGIVEVPDLKLGTLAIMNDSVKTVPAVLEFMDIAGLVKGASAGEGLGNKFLANIRECDAIVHVVRCFEDENVIHVDGPTHNPVNDAETINLELILSDLSQVEKRHEKAKKDKKADPNEVSALDKLLTALSDGRPARLVELTDEEEACVKSLGLLSGKKIIYAANVADGDLADGNEMVTKLQAVAESEGAKLVLVSAQVEAELIDLTPEDKLDFLESLGVTLEQSGLRALVTSAYDLLGLRTYYTSGPTETRAWTIKSGWLAPQAAGVIHSDFEKKFIRAETTSYDDLVEAGSESAAKASGKMRAEGKEYEVQDSDVILFRTNA